MTELQRRLRLTSPDETIGFAAALEPLLGPGDVVLLEGPIGSGKTHFARALIQTRLAAIGGPPEDVPSPTFTLVQTYAAGDVEIWHADLYRLTHPDEVEELGLVQAFDEAICLVEWPDRLGELAPDTALLATFEQGDSADERIVTLTSSDQAWRNKIDPISGDFLMMPDRAQLIEGFLARQGWDEARRVTLAGDASSRRYERLSEGPGGKTALLMDAAVAPSSTLPFQRIAEHLASLGLSAPRIFAADHGSGLMLLEDLGDALFARVLSADPAGELELYRAATDLLVEIQSHPAPEAPDFGAETMTAAVAPAFEWYRFGAAGQHDPAGEAAIRAHLSEAFDVLAPWAPVLALRDYHAENLFWLPDREGVARVGVIDFQDAVLSHPAYDLASLAYDVRRDVAPATIRAIFAHFAGATGQSSDDLARAAATLSAQRNLRILGVFARLSMQHGKARYVDLIPRTWAKLTEALSHPDLAALRAAVRATLPEPTPETLDVLREKCVTTPAP